MDRAQLAAIQAALIRADFGMFCNAALAPLGQKVARHSQVVVDALQRVAEGKCRRLMILMPPGHAKSTFGSILFPAWYLSRAPRLTMIGASTGQSLAEDFSRKAQRVVRETAAMLEYSLLTERADYWVTSRGCEYKAVGAGAKISGRRADIAVIDDPFGSRKEANSFTRREDIWNWYRGDIAGRLKPGGRVVLINTHWHEDDLTGRLLAESVDNWEVIRMQAVYDGAVTDPLGREIGEALWPDYYTAAEMELKRAEVGEIEWSALYQQNPLPAGGTIFQMDRLADTFDAAPHGGMSARCWDLAATRETGSNNPDWTAGVRLNRQPNGLFVVQDVKRFRGGPDEVQQQIYATARQDGTAVRISIPQDPGQSGKMQVLALTRMLAGYHVESSPETGDKATRAAPVAAQWNVGNVALVKGAWNDVFLAELAAFPNGTKDDQVDALSRAFSVVGIGPRPMIITEAMLAQV